MPLPLRGTGLQAVSTPQRYSSLLANFVLPEPIRLWCRSGELGLEVDKPLLFKGRIIPGLVPCRLSRAIIVFSRAAILIGGGRARSSLL